MSVFILPKLKDSDLSIPEKPGVWTQYKKSKFESIAKSLDYEAPGENKKINSVPDMWALPMTLDIPLYNNRHPLRTEAIDQWQGILAAIALAKVRNFDLKVESLDVKELSAEYPFAKALTDLLPDPTRSLHQFPVNSGRHPWQEIFIWKWKGQPVGITSPTTIVVPAAEGSWEGLPWWNRQNNRLERPHSHLNASEQGLLRQWLNNLKASVSNPGFNGNSAAKDATMDLLNEYCNSLMGGADTQDVLDKESPAYFGIQIVRGVFGGLNYPVKAKKITHDGSHVRVIASKAGAKPLLLIDRNIATVFGVSPQDVCVHLDKNLASLDINQLKTGQINGWEDVHCVEPQDLFLRDFTFIDIDNALPGAQQLSTNQPLVFRGNKITPLLPFNSLLLKYFTIEDLMQRVKIFQSGSSNSLLVTLKLPLSGLNPQTPPAFEYQIQKEYILDEQNLLEDIPVLEIWPNIKVKDWTDYYAFYYNPSRNNQCFDVSFDRAKDPHTFSDESGSKYQITRLDEFPSHINCFHNGGDVGLIPIKTPPEITLQGKWTVGVDFGTSFTNVYINHKDIVEQFKPQPLHLQVTNTTPQIRIPVLFEYFIPEYFVPDKKPMPLATVLTIRQSTGSNNVRPFYDGRIYIPDNISFRPESTWLETNIKWTDPALSKLFIQHLVLIISALAARSGMKDIHWAVSYPSAFSNNDVDRYANTWKSVIEGVKATMPIGHNVPNPQDLRTESIANAQYFADREGQNLINSVCIDLGGGTSDISIWQEQTLIHQCSIQLAGRQLLSQFLERRPELIAEWFEQDPSEWTNLQGNSFTSKMDVLLRQKSQDWLQTQRHNVEENSHFQGLMRLMTLGLSGLYYYIGKILATLKEEGRYTESDSPSVYIGGNGSRLLHWIATSGAFNDYTDLNDLFNRILAQASGLSESGKPTQLSKDPKDEVACGLVLSRTRLQGLEPKAKDPLIAGEVCKLNAQSIAALGRVSLERQEIKDFSIDQELYNLKEFVEMFNDSLKDLGIDRIPTMNTYEWGVGLDPKYSDRLWKDTNTEIRKVVLDMKGDGGKIRPEAPFIIALKALLVVLAKEWASNSR